MICEEAELRLVLGLETITESERALLAMVHRGAEAKVKEHLQYDPVQQSHTEFYPRVEDLSGGGGISWDVNQQHTRAQLEIVSRSDTLQLQHLPVRSISSLRVDTDARYGSSEGAFGSGTEWTEGQDFWVQWDQPSVCRSGLLVAYGAWPGEPGTVRVQYVAGFTADELNGESGGLDAGGIKRAVMLTAVKAFHTWQAFRKHELRGFTGGQPKSEKLGDYAYTVDSHTAKNTNLAIALPPEAEEELETYRHWGLMRL